MEKGHSSVQTLTTHQGDLFRSKVIDKKCWVRVQIALMDLTVMGFAYFFLKIMLSSKFYIQIRVF